MRMPPHSDADKPHFRALVAGSPGVEVKPMFGSVAAFVNGNMYAGLFGTDIGVKVDPAAHEELAAIEGSGPFGPAERPMGSYLSLPPSFDDEQATAWLERAREYVATFPAKVKEPRK